MLSRRTSLFVSFLCLLLVCSSSYRIFAQSDDVVALEDPDDQDQQNEILTGDESSNDDEETFSDDETSADEDSAADEQPQEEKGQQESPDGDEEELEKEHEEYPGEEVPKEDQDQAADTLPDNQEDEVPKEEETPIEEDDAAQEEEEPEEDYVEEDASDDINEDEEEEEDVLSIDTLSLSEPSGNWYFKRHWYQKSQSKYGEIGATLSKIFQQRSSFLQLNKSVQSEILDPFYTAVGIDLGEMGQAVKMLLVQIEDLRMYEGGLDEEQEALLETLSDAQDQLEQLFEDVQGISQLDKAFERSFDIMTQQIDVARSYQEQAFTAVEAISQELNDLQAKAEYLKVRSFARSVQDIQRYLAGDLFGYANRLVQHIQMQTNQVTTEIDALKQLDIDIIQEARSLRSEFCPPPVEASAQEESAEEEERSSGFFSTAVSATTNAVLWPLRALGSLFGAYPESTEIAEDSAENGQKEAHEILD